MESDDRESAIRAIRRAVDLGMTHIDTAELYGRGVVEELVGEALAGYRADVFLASKVHPDGATFAGTLRACERSLRRLRTDRLDLYMLHWRGRQPLEDTLRALAALKQEGKVLSWGVSNFDVDDLEQAIAIAGEGEIACNQVLYNLHDRSAEGRLMEFCKLHRIAFVGYSPLGAGQFPRARSTEGEVLAEIAASYNVSPHALAVAYLVRDENLFAIPKSSNPVHVEALARAGDLQLSPPDVEALDSTFGL
jgi:diketogulonate reductase-like aldo/keto reductase